MSESSSRRSAALSPPEEAPPKLAVGFDLHMLRRLWPYTRGQRPLFVASLVLMPMAALAALVQPLMIKDAIDAAIVSHSREVLLRAVLLFLVAIVIEFLARFGQTYWIQLAGQRSLANLRLDTFDKVQRLHVSYFDRTPVGRVVTRVTNDVDALGELFSSGAVLAIADLLTLSGIVAFMLALDWRLTLVAFGALPPLVLVLDVFRRRARKAFRQIRARISQLNAYLAEQVQGVAIVQAFSKSQECLEEYKQINAGYRDANYLAIRYDALLYSVVGSVAAVTLALVLWFSAARLSGLTTAQSAAWAGTVVAFFEYINRFFVPLRELAQKFTVVQSSLAAAERIFGLHELDELDAPDGVFMPEGAVPDAAIMVRFEDVDFGYLEEQRVLKQVSFDIRRGETVALVGATGAGKTTVTSLLTRLYDVRAGRVWMAGKDVRSYPVESLRRKFAWVAQDVFLFAGTVLQNVAAADDVPDEARAQEALRRVGLWELLVPRGGLHASITERGANFSAGERQLMSFARALYLDRDFLILDEATASIDSDTEARLQGAVEEVLRGRTSIVIAHRLSTIRHADRILVFHHGEVVESGTHEELMNRDGVYARLHRLQFAELAA